MNLLSRLVSRNWTLKLSALGLALLLWISVRVETPDRHDLPEIPVRVELTDPDWVLAGGPNPGSVSVRFNGPARELIRMAMDRPNVVIPVSQVHREDTTVALQSQWVRVQDRPGVVVEEIQPASIQLAFEAIQRITLPLTVRTTGTLPEGLALAGTPVLDPGEIRVSGRASQLAPLDSVPLQVVDLGEVASSDPRVIEVDTTGLSGVTFTPASASVSFRVEDEVERVVSGIPVTLPPLLSGAGWSPAPSTVTVTLTGARSLVDAVDAAALLAVVQGEPPPSPEPDTLEVDPELQEEQRGEWTAALALQGLPSGVEGALLPDSVILRPAGGGGRE